MSRDEFKQKQALDVRDERVVLSLTQSDVAVALGVTESTVWRWENGVTSPGAYDARRLRRYLRDRALAKGITPERLTAAVLELRADQKAGVRA